MGWTCLFLTLKFPGPCRDPGNEACRCIVHEHPSCPLKGRGEAPDCSLHLSGTHREPDILRRIRRNCCNSTEKNGRQRNSLFQTDAFHFKITFKSSQGWLSVEDQGATQTTSQFPAPNNPCRVPVCFPAESDGITGFLHILSFTRRRNAAFPFPVEVCRNGLQQKDGQLHTFAPGLPLHWNFMEDTPDLPHYPPLQAVPPHLTTRAGLKRLGLASPRPQPVATVTSYGKTVFLYHLNSPQDQETQDASEPAKARVRVHMQR